MIISTRQYQQPMDARVDEKVILSFIRNSPLRRNPTAEELIYLRDLGLSTDAIIAMLNSVPKVSVAQDIARQAAPVEPRPGPAAPPQQQQQQQQQYVQSPAPASSPDLVAASKPAITVMTSPAPQVVYAQQAPATVYVEAPPTVTYVPSYPRYSIGLGFGHHIFGQHGGGHYSAPIFGHHGGGHHGSGGHH